MSEPRQYGYARRKREAIFEVLGRKCAKCGDTENLGFDVIIPDLDAKSHHGAKMSWSGRMAYYCRQLSAGNLQVLCDRCNSAKHDGHERYIVPRAGLAAEPF